MTNYHQLVDMPFEEFSNEKMDLAAGSTIMTTAAMARLERTIVRFDKTSSQLSKINICIAILLGIIAFLQLIVAFKH